MTQHAGQLSFRLQTLVECRSDKDLPTGQRKGVNGLAVAKQMKLESIAIRIQPASFLQPFVQSIQQPTTDNIDMLLLLRVWIESTMLIRHLVDRSETHTDFLIFVQCNPLFFTSHRVHVSHRPVGKQSEKNHRSSDQQPQLEVASCTLLAAIPATPVSVTCHDFCPE